MIRVELGLAPIPTSSSGRPIPAATQCCEPDIYPVAQCKSRLVVWARSTSEDGSPASDGFSRKKEQALYNKYCKFKPQGSEVIQFIILQS